MYTNENEVFSDIKAKLNKADERSYEIFINERKFPKAGEYIAIIIVRVQIADTDIGDLTKKFLKLFIEGAEVKPIRSYTTIVIDKELRTVDFVLEATISL